MLSEDTEWPKEYWDSEVRKGLAYNAIRTGWTQDDFKKRTDEFMLSDTNFNYKDTDTVLEIGCGAGYSCKMVAPNVKKYIGLDFSLEMIETAKSLNGAVENAEFIVGDGKTIPFPDKFFDVIYCELVFQHTSEAATRSYFSEIKRSIKTNGTFALQIPNAIINPSFYPDKQMMLEFFDESMIDDSGTYYTYILSQASRGNVTRHPCDG